MNKTMLLDSISLLPQPTPILRLAVDPSTPNPSTLLALTESGHVNILDARSLIILKVSRAFEGAYDLRIVSSNSAVLFTADTATVLALPSLEPIQSYPLLGKCYSAAVTLAPGESDARMQLCFLEQHDGALVVRRLAEVAPERRLAMLIRQHRWVEAEALAVEHEMDIVAVLRAKLMDRVSESLNDVQIDVAEVLRDLAGCDADPKFVVEVCLQLLPQNLPDAYSLLTFALDADPGCAEVHMQLKRLGTMQLVAARYDPNEWHAFRSVDLAVELANLVARGDLHRTVVVWRRHHLDANLASHADDILAGMPDEVKPASYLAWLRDEVLPLLSGSQRARAAVWIEKRARTVEARERKPHMALKIIKLLDIEQSSSATTSGQLHHDAGGPPTPAAYVVRTVASTQSGTWASNGDDFLGKVVADSLKAQLVDLVELWDKHDLRLSLADYANETPQSIAIELLDRVAAPEMLKMAVEEHFKPYAQKNDLSCDELLTEYAAEIMEGAGSSGLAGSPWEARVLALVGCMSSIETKIETLLEVMRRAPIPWSPELDAAVTEALSWTSVRRIDELQEQYRLMQLKKMLLKYDIASFNVSDLSLALGLMRHILSRTDMIDVMPDALQVVSAYHHLNKLDAFATRLRNLFMDGLNARAIAVLHTGDELVKESVCPPGGPSPKEHAISLADQLSICGETVEWALVTMEEAVAFQDVTEERGGATYRLALNAAIDICTAILRHHLQAEPTSIAGEATTAVVGKSTEWQKRLEEFNNLRSLYDNFGFMVSPAEYHEDLLAVQNRLLGEMAREVFRYASGKSSSDRDRTSGRRTQKDLYRLAELLGVPRDDLKGVMAEEAARCGDFRTVSLLCKEIIERGHDEKVGATLRGVAARLTAYAAQHSEVFRDSRDSLFSHRLTGDIKRLAQQAIVCCSADTVPDALDAFKTYELADSIFKQCDAGDYETLLAQIDEETEKEEMIFAGGASASASGSGSGSASSSSVPIASKSAKSSIGRSSASLALDHDVRNVEDAYGKALFLDHFYENGLVLETEGTMALAAQFAVSSLAPTVPTNGSAKSKSKTTESRGPVASGRELVDYLSRNQCRMLTLHVWQRILEHTIRKNPENAVAEFQVEELGQRGYFDLITSLLQTVLSTRYIDDTLALGFMLCLPLEKAFEAYKMGVQTTGTEYHRLVKIATIGCAAGAAWSQRSFQLDCQQLGTNARWWQQLRLLEIPFDEAAYRTSRGGEYQRGVVVPLLQKTSFDLLTVLEFSRTYNIEDDFVLLNYVKLLLQEDADSSYAWKIAAVIDDVVNREKLQKLLLEHCYPTISPYDYESALILFCPFVPLDDLTFSGCLILQKANSFSLRYDG